MIFLTFALLISPLFAETPNSFPEAPAVSSSVEVVPAIPTTHTTTHKNTFLASPINRFLLIGDGLVRQSDALTTYEASKFYPSIKEATLPESWAMSYPAVGTYSAVVTVALGFVSREVWGDGHSRTRRSIARSILIGDMLCDGKAVLGNYHAIEHHPPFYPSPTVVFEGGAN